MNETGAPRSSDIRFTPETISSLFWLGDQIPGGFFIYRADDSQQIVYVNRATLRIFGCDTQEEFRALTGNTFRGLVHPEDFDAVQSSIDQQIADNANENLDYVEYRILRKDGELRWVDDFGHFAQMPGFGDVYYVFISDITEKKRIKEEQFQAELALRQEKQRNEMISSFLFNLSHDIRTPMNAIIGFSGLASLHRKEPDKLDGYLDKIASSSRQLLSLIDDMLEMNSLESGTITLKSEPADLREQLSMVIDLFRIQMQEKHLSLTEDVDLPDGAVLTDPTCFRRVMGNLLGNAVKFTPPGGAVTVSARRRSASDSGFARYAFTVRDTGVGMTESFMERMFDAFEREESSTKTGDSGTGTGLGLTIVKSLVDKMGGTVSAESRKGAGSAFTVELPLKLADSARQTAPEHREDGAARAVGEHRILIVEDIELNRLLLEDILEEAGFLTESAPDGCDAVEAVKAHPPGYYDLILMDIQMPVMNGYEATRTIRTLERENGDRMPVPILALSANCSQEDIQRSLESGMDKHISKPFDAVALIHTINEFIAHRATLDPQ